MTRWLGISAGDPAGIGPEVALRALALETLEEDWRFLLLGNEGQLTELNRQLRLALPLQRFRNRDEPGRCFIYDPLAQGGTLNAAAGSPAAAQAAMVWLAEGGQRALRGELAALVTAPLNKEAILRTGVAFTGQTEFLSQMAGAARTAMMLLGQDQRGRWLRVALATTHIPLKSVAVQLTPSRVEQVIELAAEACRRLGLPRARIGVCGLNPHAGEGGLLGTEEIELIAPAVRQCQERQIDSQGPLPADTLFYQAYRGDFDVVVAMYHDQGLAPLKMIGFETGVNWTLGLPFIRTSPDHGTAYDIAGLAKANPASMSAAIKLAKRLATGPAGPRFSSP